MQRILKTITTLALGLTLTGGVLAGGAGPVTTKSAPFTNPVLDTNFPDPFILNVSGTYYAYATGSGGQAIQLATSRDLVHWAQQGDALGQQPTWASPGLTWAPEVMRFGSKYVMYYTTHDDQSGRQCISTAVASTPLGPFNDASKAPLVCQADLGGSIDPSPFTDTDGQHYLIYKNDGNCCNLPTGLYIQKLSADGLSLTGKPTELFRNDELWEGNVIEAPTLHVQDGVYYLLYSAGPWDSDLYAVGYATARKVTGPYKKFAGNPLVVSAGQVAGPGHQALVKDAAGHWWLAYHAWTAGFIGNDAGERSLRLDPIRFQNGKVVFGGVTTKPQPAPAH